MSWMHIKDDPALSWVSLGVRGHIKGESNVKAETGGWVEVSQAENIEGEEYSRKMSNAQRQHTTFGELKTFSPPGKWSLMEEWQKMRLERQSETSLWTALWLIVESRLYHKGNKKPLEFLKQGNDLTRFVFQKDYSGY